MRERRRVDGATIRVIGHDLKNLKIEDITCPNTPLDEYSEQVILACPNLETLELCHMDLNNFQFVFDAFHAWRLAKLKNLTLFSIGLRDHVAVERLLDELADRGDPVGKTLRILVTQREIGRGATTPDTTLRMLSSTSRLRDMRLNFRQLPALAADIQSQLESFDLSIVPESLLQRSILAFLSVVASARDANGNFAFEWFDSKIAVAF